MNYSHIRDIHILKAIFKKFGATDSLMSFEFNHISNRNHFQIDLIHLTTKTPLINIVRCP